MIYFDNFNNYDNSDKSNSANFHIKIIKSMRQNSSVASYDIEANTGKNQKNLIGQEMAIRFSIGNQASSPNSEAITAPK